MFYNLIIKCTFPPLLLARKLIAFFSKEPLWCGPPAMGDSSLYAAGSKPKYGYFQVL